MIEFRLAKMKVKMDFSFFSVLAIFIYFDYNGYGIYNIIACLIHELGHIIALLSVRTAVDEVFFYGAGIKIKSYDRCKLKNSQNLYVLLAGSGLNIILFAVLYLVSDKTSIYLPMFAVINLIIGFFNLLPIGNLDGRGIINLILGSFLSFNAVKSATYLINIITAIAILSIAVIIYINGAFNFVIATTIAYLLVLSIISIE